MQAHGHANTHTLYLPFIMHTDTHSGVRRVPTPALTPASTSRCYRHNEDAGRDGEHGGDRLSQGWNREAGKRGRGGGEDLRGGCALLFFSFTGLFHMQFTEGKSLTCNAEPQPSRWSLLPHREGKKKKSSTITWPSYIITMCHHGKPRPVTQIL